MKLKIGDKVAVYCVRGRRVTTVRELCASGFIAVWDENDKEQLLVHPKQCRKLVKTDARHVWMHKDGGLYRRFPPIDEDRHDYIEFIEVRRRK